MFIISEKANIGSNFKHGHFVVIEEDVVIGDNVEVGHNVIIRSGVRIGDNCKILDGAILGKRPQKANLSATTGEAETYAPLVIGEAVTVGASCIVYVATEIGNLVFLGDKATVREDVRVGEQTIIGRGVTSYVHIIV